MLSILPPLRSLALTLNWNMLVFIVPRVFNLLIFYKVVHHIMKIYPVRGQKHTKTPR